MKASKNLLFYLLPFILAVWLLLTAGHTFQVSSASVASAKGRPLPAFNLPTLFQPLQHFTNQNLQGKVSLFNIWASWCSSCQAEHAVLMAIKEHYFIPIYGINFKDNTDNAKIWLKKAGNPYIMLGADPTGTIERDWGIDGIPATFLIDAHGMIRYFYKGALNKDSWENILLPLITQLINE
jgi:cytochrome c biogenesis protein CcmG/thiol:disulfide interchange protein DsbE